MVNQAVWDWLDEPYDTSKSSYYEQLPPAVIEEMKKNNCDETSVLVTRGSYDNDRALAAPGKNFNSRQDLNKYLKENKISIEDEYDGYSY